MRDFDSWFAENVCSEQTQNAVSSAAMGALKSFCRKVWDAASTGAKVTSPHVWCKGLFKQCIQCGEWKNTCGHPEDPCDPSKLAGKTESCCECGEDYPKGDLIAGEVFCPACREEEKAREAKRK